LTPRIFWENEEATLFVPETEDETEGAIDAIVRRDAFE
jgi:hypothetical protein